MSACPEYVRHTDGPAFRRIVNQQSSDPCDDGTGARLARFRRMLKNVAFAIVLTQVAAVAGLVTETLLFASSTTEAANVEIIGEPVAAVTEKECDVATLPNTPEHCPKRAEARKLRTTFVLMAGN